MTPAPTTNDLYKDYTSTSVLSDVDPEKFIKWSHAYFKEVILPHFPIERNISVLEIGCGFGRYTSLMVNELNYSDVAGIDISEEQIEYAKHKFNLKNVFVNDALVYMEQEDKKYDIILLMDVLEHLELNYAISLLKKINGSLKTNGKLIVQVPNGLSPLKPIFYGDVTHIRAFSVNSMSQIFRMSGFTRFNHYAIPPVSATFQGFLRRIMWKSIVNPLIFIAVKLTNGDSAGGIYSSNLLSVARKQ